MTHAPARRHHRRHARTRDCRAVLHAPTGRPRRARDQGRAPRRRRFRARLRRARARPGLAFRLDQPLEGKPDARREAAGSAAILDALLADADVLVQNLAPGAAARLGLSYEALTRTLSAPDRLRHLRLRRRRPVPRQEGLRPADPERIRLPVGHRHAGRAGQGRLLDRGHRGRHVRVLEHPGARCSSAARTGQGLPHRRLDAGEHGRVDELSAVLRDRRRRAAAARRRGARDDLSRTARSRPATARW